jgi:formylglycine-generating enzyme required for sulfatase activity
MRRLVLFAMTLALAAYGLRAAADRVVNVALSAPAAVLIHAGSFEMGSDDNDVRFAVSLCIATADDASLCRPELFVDEQPRHRVYVSAFRIDRTEVALGDYLRCVQRGVCAPARVVDGDARLGQAQHPVTGVTAAEARRYCEWVGGRLPTEAEWERAARGIGRRRFPWGREWNSRVANHGLGVGRPGVADGYDYAAPVTAFADGRSAYGLLNMAGNVWELTADRYALDAYGKSEKVDPHGPGEGDEIVIRGGSWRSPPHTLRATQRGAIKQDDSQPDVGFRCAYNVP